MPIAEPTTWLLFLEWVARYRVGDLSSMLGVLISVVGFAVTIWNVMRSKAAALQAREDARRAFGYADVLAKVPKAIMGISEIKRLHRDGADLGLLAEKYTQLRSMLVEIKDADHLASNERAVVRQAVNELGQMESRISDAIADGTNTVEMADRNQTLISFENRLTELQVSLQKKSGELK